jgi:uncharacterized membrane protein YphA (DoxX/SURF4 family)
MCCAQGLGKSGGAWTVLPQSGADLRGTESQHARVKRTMRLVLTVCTRLVPAGVFVVFGADEFVSHGRNARSFALYGLPDPSLFSYAIGSLEIVGALALLCGIALLPAAVALAGDMVGAIVVSGIALGELVSLTLAPAMLVAMLTLIARELSDRRARARSLPSPSWRDGALRDPAHG